jgi:hypothetical protein
MLTSYLTDTRELLHDPTGQYYSDTDLTNYINRGRKRIALRGQCVRILLSGGTITALAINSPGSGYAGSLTVTISGAGQQATATGTISGGAVNTVTLVNGGWGYITGSSTTVAAVGSTSGTNATFTVTTDNSLTTIPGQEVYSFATANNLVVGNPFFPGMLQIAGVFSVAGAWGANAAMKPLLKPEIWTNFQAYYRSYNNGMQNYPTVWAQYAQGAKGSIYLWPLPSQFSQMDWDCWCEPIPLVDDTTAEAIPYPWTDCVSYYAAMLAYDNAQRAEDSKKMMDMFTAYMKEAQAASLPPFVPDYYESD